MKLAILGSSGFVGHKLAGDLLARGHQVLTVSRGVQPRVSQAHKHATMPEGNPAEIRALLADVDLLFHLACDSTPGSTRLNPVAEGAANVLPFLHLLEALQDLPKLRLVFVSSGGAIYRADSDMPPSKEDSALSPHSYYGAGKLTLEFFIEAYHNQTGNGAFILRPSNLYGPGQRPRQGFGIVPTLLTALRDGLPFTIWGDGSARRDFLYIDDFLDLCNRTITHDWTSQPAAVINAGAGESISILKLCDLVEQVTGRGLHRNFAPQRDIDLPVARLDMGKAQATLGWSARRSLQQGLENTWEWFLKARP